MCQLGQLHTGGMHASASIYPWNKSTAEIRSKTLALVCWGFFSTWNLGIFSAVTRGNQCFLRWTWWIQPSLSVLLCFSVITPFLPLVLHCPKICFRLDWQAEKQTGYQQGYHHHRQELKGLETNPPMQVFNFWKKQCVPLKMSIVLTQDRFLHIFVSISSKEQ